MDFQTLKFTIAAAREPAQAFLSSDTAESFRVSLTEERPAAYVVRSGALEPLRVLTDVTVDRGVKDPRKGLSAYLLRKKLVPLIDGRHVASGQLVRSVNDLLRNAAKMNDGNAYVIGTPPDLFDELWEATAVSSVSGTDRTPRVSRSISPPRAVSFLRPALTLPVSRAEQLLTLLGNVEVDDALRERYMGTSVQMRLVRALVMQAAKTSDPVLILGESGTGKEIVARAVHERSDRRDGAFVAVNCAAIAKDLLESELFGHKKGSFTGARSDKMGLWEVADGGTLFLDEIGDLAPDHQSKILRALQQGTIRRVGDKHEIRVSPRIIAATNRNLFGMVREKTFRDDLYYRLRGFQIQTPSLRDCPEDLPMLCRLFWRKISGVQNAQLSDDTVAVLMSHYWPGNVRELKAVLRSAYGYFRTPDVTAQHLDLVMRREEPGEGATASAPDQALAVHRVECLHHLQRAADVVWACKRALTGLADIPSRTAPPPNEVAECLQRHLGELDVLCLHPLLFHSETAFSALSGIREHLLRLHQGLCVEPEQAATLWETEVSGECESVLVTVFQEAEQLTAGV